jgi:hypothetical protein
MMAGCTQQGDEIIVENKSDKARTGEMVEVDMQLLKAEAAEGVVVRNDKGEIVPSQVTHNGKLIFQCDAEAGAKVEYRVEYSDLKAKQQTYACGKVYPDRVDDLAWESDLIAYRAYGPALQQSGERAFGYDVWVKNNTDLPVVEERYNKELNPETKAQIAALRESDPAAADALAASVSYHNDHGNGMDAYKVGPTLGGGATALLDKKDRIVYPYCYAECEILDNGPLRFTAKLTYHPTKVDGREVREVRTISIDKGAFLNRTTVVYEGTDGDELDVMAGIVLHEQEPRTLLNEQHNYLTYAEVVEALDGGELYQALYFPNGWSGAENRLWKRGDEKPAGTFGHAAVYNRVAVGEPLIYYWGALWSKSTLVEVADKAAFDALMAERVAAKENPLEVTVITYEN